MQVISHRGLWSAPQERNSLAAFTHSFERGFGAEVDVRDRNSELVVAHDLPTKRDLRLESLLESHRRIGPELPLALNVKSCGLAAALRLMLAQFSVESYFVFDMAVPDALDYVRKGMRAFTRVSEHEVDPAFYPLAAGVWLDCFEHDWVDAAVVEEHLDAGKAVALVSPELHGRPHLEAWQRWAAMRRAARTDLYLCTDHPQAARELFSVVARR